MYVNPSLTLAQSYSTTSKAPAMPVPLMTPHVPKRHREEMARSDESHSEYLMYTVNDHQ